MKKSEKWGRLTWERRAAVTGSSFLRSSGRSRDMRLSPEIQRPPSTNIFSHGWRRWKKIPARRGILILLNTLGGDVEAGLAIAEMIASLSKPTVSLVLGGSHSIGGPLAVSADYSFIVPTGTMIVHPVRSTGMFIGVIQSYRNMERTQDRIARFISDHSRISQERLVELMLDSTQLVKDVGTMLEGEDAVREGLIDEVGGISQAFAKLHEMIEERRSSTAVQSNNREN